MDAIQERIAKIIAHDSIPLNNIAAKRFLCAACGERPDSITRHHLIPKEVGTDHRTIRLCQDCHDEIHRLPNRHLAVMSERDQIAFINIRRPRTANFPALKVMKAPRIKVEKEPDIRPHDFVHLAMKREAGIRAHKIKRDHRNRHHGTGS